MSDRESSAVGVLPTRVGMVRACGSCSPRAFRSPHARGDGPLVDPNKLIRTMFSPRAWGWSDQRSRVGVLVQFSPRAWGWSGDDHGDAQRLNCSPHARGDGPHAHRLQTRAAACSPHARGDGPSGRTGGNPPEQFSPRAWGWSAVSAHVASEANRFSPRAWGWSVPGPGVQNCRTVLPTRVGMVRIRRRLVRAAGCSPHARGDGP